MRRHLVLFVRAPQLGVGKRRLAREIGDVATVRFERLMIALLLRRLARDRRAGRFVSTHVDRFSCSTWNGRAGGARNSGFAGRFNLTGGPKLETDGYIRYFQLAQQRPAAGDGMRRSC